MRQYPLELIFETRFAQNTSRRPFTMTLDTHITVCSLSTQKRV